MKLEKFITQILYFQEYDSLQFSIMSQESILIGYHQIDGWPDSV